MNGWAGFWIMIAIVSSTEMVVDYLFWRTKALYKVNNVKRNRWWVFWKHDFE